MEWIPVALFAVAIVIFGMSALSNADNVVDEDDIQPQENEERRAAN